MGALTAVAKAAAWYEEAGSTIDESVARRLLARCHFDEQEWEEGFDALDRAYALAEKADFRLGLIECLELRARALATTEQLGPARTALLQALALTGGTASDDDRRFHQMLATLAEDSGDKDVARQHLEQARLLAARSGDPLKIADVAHQIEHIGDKQRTRGPAPQEVIDALARRLRETESPVEAARTMQQLGGAHRSRDNYAKARDWYKRAHGASTALSDDALAASALIGLAELAIVTNDDRDAEDLIRRALDLVESVPAWEVRASGQYFLGRLCARRGDLSEARDTLDKARATAAAHHIEQIEADAEDYLEEVNEMLSLRAAPSRTLVELSDEIATLETWYPEAKRRVRRFWWYQRGDDILRNVLSHGGAKGLVVSERASEVTRVVADLAVMFDLTAFVSEQPWVLPERALFEFVPMPENRNWPFVNIVGVKTADGY